MGVTPPRVGSGAVASGCRQHCLLSPLSPPEVTPGADWEAPAWGRRRTGGGGTMMTTTGLGAVRGSDTGRRQERNGEGTLGTKTDEGPPPKWTIASHGGSRPRPPLSPSRHCDATMSCPPPPSLPPRLKGRHSAPFCSIMFIFSFFFVLCFFHFFFYAFFSIPSTPPPPASRC